MFCGKLNGVKFTSRILNNANIESTIEYKGTTAKCTVLTDSTFALHKIVKDNNKAKAQSDKIKAQITGRLVSMYVKQGDNITKGDPLFVIDAMKMQNTFTAERQGIIAEIYIEPNSNVSEGDLILRFVK